MREIKFRAWDKVREEMAKVTNLDFHPTVVSLTTGTGREQDEFELMQYTGLLDKEGKEMYDQDIIKVELYDEEYEYFVIRWNDDYCGYVLDYDSCGYEEFNNWLDTSTFEIVGNTFENYELLQDKK